MKAISERRCIALGLMLAVTAAAQAAPPSDEGNELAPSVGVNFGDLNLSSAADQKVLRHRIETAAGHVCRVTGLRAMEDVAVSSACYSGAYWGAIRQLNELTATKRAGAAIAATAVVIKAR